MNSFIPVFAQTSPGTEPGGFMLLFPMYFIIFLVFYIFLIRPQKKKQKEHQEMMSRLTKNDAVVTSGGVHGIVAAVKDKTVVLKVDDNVKIEFDRNSIVTVIKSRSEK